MADNNSTTNTPAPAASVAPTPAPKTDGAPKAPEAAVTNAATGAPSAPKEAPKQPTQAEIRRLKLKMEGQDIELPEEEVIKLAQMGGSAQKRFQEAAQLRKEAEQVVEWMKSNPAQALKELGIDVRKFSEDTLMEMIRREQESPEQKKIREQEEKLRAYEEKERQAEEARQQKEIEAKKAREQQELDARAKQFMDQYDAEFTKALSESDLPRNAYTIRRMADLQRINLKKGFELDASSLAKIVRQDYDREHSMRLDRYKTPEGKYDGEKLLAFFGDDLVKALNKAQVKKLKAANAQKFSTPVQESTQTKPAPTSSWREFSKRKRALG